KPLGDLCEQSAIVSRKISGALEGIIGPVEGIPQDLAVFEPSPSILRSDGKQRLDRLCGSLESQELKLDSRKNQTQFCASWTRLHRCCGNSLSLHIPQAFQQELSKCEPGGGEMRFGRDCVSQQIFGPCSQPRSVGHRWSRLGFQISSLLPQTRGKRKSRSGEERPLDERSLQEALELRPLLPRCVTTRCSKVLFQQGNKRGPRNGGMRCQSIGFAQHILCLHSEAPRAKCGRHFRHLLGGAIRVGHLPNINCAHPCGSVVGSPRTPQLQADTGCHQQQVGARRRDGQQGGAGHVDRCARDCATTLPSDTSYPKPHDLAPPQNAARSDARRSSFEAFQNMTAALTF